MRERKYRVWWSGQYFTGCAFYEGSFYLPSRESIGDGYEQLCVRLTADYVMLGAVGEDYTGLKDKNGKEIYEGDILRWYDSYGSRHLQALAWGFGSDRDARPFSGFIIDCDDSDSGVEVVGNIHENPELLQRTK